MHTTLNKCLHFNLPCFFNTSLLQNTSLLHFLLVHVFFASHISVNYSKFKIQLQLFFLFGCLRIGCHHEHPSNYPHQEVAGNKWSSTSLEGNSIKDRNSRKTNQNVQVQQMSSLHLDSEPILVVVRQLALAGFMIPWIRQRKINLNIRFARPGL